MPPANRELTRAINQFHVLNEIRKAGCLSRVEIAELTGQSRSSVTTITALLMDQGLILEKKTHKPTARGRRRTMLTLNPEAAYVVGVKISAFQISFAVVDFKASVKASLIMPIRTGQKPVQFMADVIEEGVRHCVAQCRLSLDDISGIGIGVPGFVDSTTGICHWTPLYKPGEIPLQDLMRQRLGVTTVIENDANAVTVGEQWFGLGVGIDNFIVVTIEHGVGMGIVVHGALYRGATGVGAEVGHMVVIPDGEPCRCGKKGCIEAYVSDYSILRRAKAVLEQRRDKPNLDMLTIEDVTEMARKGDAAMAKLFREGGEMLGLGVAGLIQIFNPERVIITGEGVRAGDLMFASTIKTTKKLLNKEVREAAEIIIQEWADDDWARGAAGFMLSELYQSPLDTVHSMLGEHIRHPSPGGIVP
ncbi:MAG: ROK family transcriptional regulator [Desulfovibrio sp.]|nr:MAG: ROK family transcriptional regulator [Desulfovibrio sp.]